MIAPPNLSISPRASSKPENDNFIASGNDEINLLHKFVRDKYAKQFPELETLILNSLDYARVLLFIINIIIYLLFYF